MTSPGEPMSIKDARKKIQQIFNDEPYGESDIETRRNLSRQVFRDAQLFGKIVMFDSRKPGDHERARAVLVVATENGFLVRVGLKTRDLDAIDQITGRDKHA